MDRTRREFLARGGALVALGAVGSLGIRLPAARAQTPVGPFADFYRGIGEPRGLMLSHVGDLRTTRTITWLSTGNADHGSRVLYGAVPQGAPEDEVQEGRFLDRTMEGASELAPFGFGDVGPTRGTPNEGEQLVRVHRATLTDLPPDATISYRLVGGGPPSPVNTFKPAPSATSGFTFTHIGDHGRTEASRRTTRACAALAPNFHLIAGDLSYANGDQREWDAWAGELETLSASIPILLSPGNHEAKDWDGDTYRSRFTFPNHGQPWFSYDYQNLHVVSTTAGAFLSETNTDSARELVIDELTWLEADLAEAAARRAAGEIDFIAVTQHFPLYTDHRTRGPFSPQLVAVEEAIFQRYQVDLVLVGHDHMYQRSKPMAYGVPTGVDAGGPGYVQIVAGGGGKSIYEFTPIDTTEAAVDPENQFMRWGLWSAAHAASSRSSSTGSRAQRSPVSPTGGWTSRGRTTSRRTPRRTTTNSSR